MVTTILVSIFGVFAFLFAITGLVERSLRSRLWPGAMAAGAAALAAQSDAFWVMVSFGLLGFWFAILALPIGELRYRVRLGLVKVVGIYAFLILWPTLDILSGGKLPCPAYVEERVEARLVAGLDLRGGLRLVYTVDVAEAIKDKRNNYYEDMQRELSKVFVGHQGDQAPSEETLKALREKVLIEAPRSPANLIRVKVQAGADPAKVDARFRDLFKVDLSVKQVNPSELEFTVRESTESSIRERAVSQAKEIIHRRVDALGLREAAISTRDEDIIVEVPGQDEAAFKQIREIIGQTARLEFKLLDEESDFFRKLSQTAPEGSLPDGLEFRSENAPAGLNESGEQITVPSTYAFLPIRKEKGETAVQVQNQLKTWINTLDLPADREVGYELEYQRDPSTLKQTEDGFRTFMLRARTEITGDMVREALAQSAQSGSTLGGWQVSLSFTDQGAKIFDRITGANVKRRFAILLDGRVESAPVINERIAGGQASITTGGDPEVQLRDARKLELVLRSGALPAPITPSNEQLIGPSLGKDAIELGVQGAAAGSLLVLLFMMFYYRVGGLIADISVLMNLFLQLAILASFGASMTLPGIAGLALTLGMGVDANVLINERMREELKDGKSPRAAVELGYSKALSAIVDGQLTTFIAGLVLMQYGTGPIKGFAVTLMVGVLCSIFTGVVVSRVLFEIWLLLRGKNAAAHMV